MERIYVCLLCVCVERERMAGSSSASFGGRSNLRSRIHDKDYSETLAHVYETAVAEMDKKQSRRRSRNPFQLCMRNAADDVVVVAMDDNGGGREELPPDEFITTTTNNNMTPHQASYGQTYDATFLLKGNGPENPYAENRRRGSVRHTLIGSVRTSFKKIASGRKAFHDQAVRYDKGEHAI